MTFEFYLPKNGTQRNIHLTLTDKQQNIIYVFRTSLRILADNWDSKKQRPSNIYLKKDKQLNAKLDMIKKELSEHVREKHSQKKQPLKRMMSQVIKTICSRQLALLPENSLLHYTNWYIENKKDLICHSTYKRYRVFFHLLERFEGYLCKRLYIDEINSDFIRDFVTFGKEEEYSENTIYRTVHFVKTILNFAERKGIRTAVRELELRRERQRKELVTLTEKELEKIKNTKVPEEFQAAKDWLIISCYTGQRFSDFMNFSKDQLKRVGGKQCLSFMQQKTGKEIVLPLHPAVMQIIECNKSHFPKLMTIQHYNHHIKEIARIAQLKKRVKTRKRIHYRSQIVEVEKWEVLTSHIGRRSFATNFYGKIPTYLLMGATGHSTEEMFLRYINLIDKDKILSLSNYFDKVYEKDLAI